MIVGLIRRLLDDRTGATAIEYGLIVALVVIASIAGMVTFAGATTGLWNTVSTNVLAALVG